MKEFGGHVVFSIAQDIAAKYGLRKSGNRYTGPCPKCGGSKDSDKFVLFPDGGFRCFACGFKGDRIKWLREMDGMSCREAHDSDGKDCSPSCPNYGPCRNGEPVKRRPRSVRPQVGNNPDALPEIQTVEPGTAWSTWAGKLLEKAQQSLAKEPEEIRWLESRGIGSGLVDQSRLGWLAHDLRVNRRELGLPFEEGKERLWVPGGLVIPIFDGRSELHRLRIRRTPAAREKFLADRKYVWIKGSGNLPMVLRPTGTVRGAVIVEAELDAMAVAAAHGDVLVVALGTVAGGIDAKLRAELETCPVILVALDADPAKDGKLGAGPASVKRWRQSFRQARFWPMPAGKDPGDFVRDHGGDLRRWVQSGLPPVLPCPTSVVEKPEQACSVPVCQDRLFSPEQRSSGDGGGDFLSVAALPMDDIESFANLLRAESGLVWYGRAPHGELVVRFRRDAEDLDAFMRRGQITRIMYGGGAVADFLEMLPRGQYIGADALLQLQNEVTDAV
ncbi:MAG: CHC2 zinc finger domain-containing protein [Desulfobulbus sp.]